MSTIQTYPHFSKLTLELRDQITGITSLFDPYSDFNFTSLFAWNTDGSTEISLLNGNLVIKMPDYLDGHDVYSILGTTNIDESLQILLAATSKLELLPEATIQAITDKTAFHIKEDEDNFDYIYDLDHLSTLPGNHFKKKRNKTNVFIKAHEHYELIVKAHHSITAEHVDRIKQVDKHWTEINPRDEGDILSERKALSTLLDNAASFKLILTEVIVDGELKAFSINELISHDFAICHFEKALKTHHEHLNTFLTIEVAKQLRAAGPQWVNWEQDLGLDGLRRSKQSYHPVRMLKKYTVSAGHQKDSTDHHHRQS